jgi:hypothetical protein
MDPRVQVLTFALQNLDIDMQPIKKKICAQLII